MTTEYTNAFTAAMNVQAEDNASFDATEDPTLPEGYDEIYDGGLYLNNPTLVNQLRSLVKESQIEINNINIVEASGTRIVTIFVTNADSSKAYEISFATTSEINTARDLNTALEQGESECSITEYNSIDQALSGVLLDSDIRFIKDNFASVVNKNSQLSNYEYNLSQEGDIYIKTNTSTGEFEVIYFNNSGENNLSINSFVGKATAGNKLLSDKGLKLALISFLMNGGLISYEIVGDSINVSRYNNEGETYIEQDLETPENDGREM